MQKAVVAVPGITAHSPREQCLNLSRKEDAMHRKIILPVVLSLVVVSAGWSYLNADDSATMTDEVKTEVIAPAVPQPATDPEVNNDSTLPEQGVIIEEDAMEAVPAPDEELALEEGDQTEGMVPSEVMTQESVTVDEVVNEPAKDAVVPQPVVSDDVVVPHDAQPTDVNGGVVPKSDDSTKDIIKHDTEIDEDLQCAPAPVNVDEPAKADVPAAGALPEAGVQQDGTLAEADVESTMVPPAEVVKHPSDDNTVLPVCTETGQENCIAPEQVPAPVPTKDEDHLAQAQMEVNVEAPATAPAVAEPVVPPNPVLTPPSTTIEQTGVSKEPGQAGLYMDRLKKFTVQFPETWEVKPGMAGMDVVGISPLEGPNDTFRENVNVASQILQAPIKMEDFYTQGKKALSEQLPAFKELGVGDSNVNGLQVHWIEFSQASNNVQANIKQYYILSKDGSRAYIITGAAPPEKFDSFKATMDKIVQSFKVEN
ncbi:MAG: hypothetical protein WC222_06130 [Parachlamydiales bacterium]